MSLGEGSKVIHPLYGPGVVGGIETMTVDGSTIPCLVIKLKVREGKVFVPLDAIEKFGIRRPFPKDKIDFILEVLRSSEREKEYSQIYAIDEDLQQTDVVKNAERLHDLHLRNMMGGRLSAADRRSYQLAHKLVAGELAMVKGISFNKASQFVNDALKKAALRSVKSRKM